MNEDIREILSAFLKQAKTSNLKTSHFPNTYSNLKLKVSFGQGNTARIPWASFLGNGQTTSNGFYPVYLYFKDYQKLILAYGISETNTPQLNWEINSNTQSINQYFFEKNIKPDRYGSSFVYEVYDLKKELNWNKIESDLSEIINKYKEILYKNQSKINTSANTTRFEISKINNDLESSGLRINNKLIIRFITSLLTKPFVILTGLSGSGKTKLAQAFVMWICKNENQYSIVPVGADWTNREPLLGFPNALNNEEYIKPDNGVLDLIINATENPQKPYFLILDEMNLSHVERYFADFLSVMESKSTIKLYSGSPRKSSDGIDIPQEISWPENLFIIGTVNIDETTYMFSPKVLDRANVIEFRVTATEMASYLSNSPRLDLNSIIAQGADMAEHFVELAKDKDIASENIDQLNNALTEFFSELKKTGAEFGYRSASEIIRFYSLVNKIEPAWHTDIIIDAAIIQKLLPKLHGSRSKLTKVLSTLGELCLKSSGNIKSDYFDKYETINFDEDPDIKYPLSLEKISRMYKNVIDNGFTSYAEA